jgi:MinD-like ATPase involved in chromosome partitioning or flagellar assembly
VGVYDPSEAEGSGKQRLLDLQVDEVIEADASPTEFLRILARVSSSSTGEQHDDLAALVADLAGPAVERRDPYESTEGRTHRGRLLVVTGASGGVGATEVAIGLTAILADRGDKAVLVDADDVGPSVAQRLGMVVHPNLRTAIDVVRNNSGNPAEVLIDAPSGDFEVLGGLANRRDWFELRPGDVAETVLRLARIRDHIIVNVSSRLEDLPAMGGPARYGVTRSLLALADTVILVANPTPIGVARVLDWIAEAKPLVEATPLFVAFNAFRGGAFRAAEIEAELRRVYQPGAIVFIPHDKSLVHATWQGLLPGRGPFVKSLEHIAISVVPPGRSTARHRKKQ